MTSHLSRRTVLAGLAAGLVAGPAWASEPRPPFRRGASIHNLMNWAHVEDGDRTRYRRQPFATPAHQLMPGILPNMKQAGFDFIRLTLDPGPFLQFNGADRDDLDRQLVATIGRLMEAGFGVVADFHPNWQNPTYAPEKITAVQDGPLAKAYGEMLKRTARLLKPLGGGPLAFELMNEPQWGWDAPTTARWQAIQKGWHDEVRAIAPDLMLVLTGARGGDREGLLAMDAGRFAGSNVLWSFHYYKPYLLTHQGVKADNESARFWRYFSDLPYPAAPEHYEDTWRIIRRNIETDGAVRPEERPTLLADARKALADYLELRPGRAMVAKDFAEVETWAARNRVPPQRIFLGEFGITRTYGRYRASPPETLENYLSDVRSEAEARGFGWAMWAVSGYGGMSLIRDDDKPDLDGPTLRGLGLTPR